MVAVLGLDIGGANIKTAFVVAEHGKIKQFQMVLEFFPIWKRDSKQLCDLLSKFRQTIPDLEPKCVGLTMTAELSDAYQTKREGVNHVLECASRAFAGLELLVLDVNGNLRTLESARSEPLMVAAANWAATGWMASQLFQYCVAVDVGSTSTSIIPVENGKVAANGKNDLKKLVNGELVYTGSLRTNVAATVSSLPVRGGTARVSSEFFAQSGDVHRVLGHITETEYTVETPDGRGKTREECLARLARVVCADTEMLSEPEIMQIARHVYKQQIEQIAEALTQVYSRLKPKAKQTVPTVVTGLGRDFLARKAAEKAGVAKTIDFGDLYPGGAALASPAAGVAYMTASKLEGEKLKWMQ